MKSFSQIFVFLNEFFCLARYCFVIQVCEVEHRISANIINNNMISQPMIWQKERRYDLIFSHYCLSSSGIVRNLLRVNFAILE